MDFMTNISNKMAPSPGKCVSTITTVYHTLYI